MLETSYVIREGTPPSRQIHRFQALLADIAMLRSQPELYGLVASDPTVSRLVDALASEPVRALKAIRLARAAARELAGQAAPGSGGELIPVDLERAIVIAHSEKETGHPDLEGDVWVSVRHEAL
jgi:hypothetical protein